MDDQEAIIAVVTDYDCGKVEEEPVSAETVIGHLHANITTAKRLLAAAIPRVPREPNCPGHRALDGAIMTGRKLWPEATVNELRTILARLQ